MTIQKKIETRRYASLGRALSAVNRSKLTKPEKKVLLKLAQTVYSQPLVEEISLPIKRDRLEPMADIGKLDGYGEAERDILRLSMWTMGTMVKYHLSREQVFDRVKETLINAMGMKG